MAATERDVTAAIDHDHEGPQQLFAIQDPVADQLTDHPGP
jgi:hypothetical protein